jgi:hypothetical protein
MVARKPNPEATNLVVKLMNEVWPTRTSLSPAGDDKNQSMKAYFTPLPLYTRIRLIKL